MVQFYPNGDLTIIEAVDIASADATLATAKWLRVNGAGDVIVRAPGSSADVIIPAKDGEYIPVAPGVIVRKTGTTATSLVAFGGW